MSVNELSQRIDISPVNISRMRRGHIKAVRFFLPLRNLLDAAKKGRRGTSVFPGDTFLGGAALGDRARP